MTTNSRQIRPLVELTFRAAHELSGDLIRIEDQLAPARRRGVLLMTVTAGTEALAHMANAEFLCRGSFFSKLEALAALRGARDCLGKVIEGIGACKALQLVTEGDAARITTNAREVVAMTMAVTVAIRGGQGQAPAEGCLGNERHGPERPAPAVGPVIAAG